MFVALPSAAPSATPSAALAEPPLLFAIGLFLMVLGLLIAVLTPWLAAVIGPVRLPAARRSRGAPRHKAAAPVRAT
jgi:hypothetical protein